MARKLSDREIAVLDTLPATGAISYEQWLMNINSAGLSGSVGMVHKLRRAKAVKFSMVRDEATGSILHMAERAASGGE